ncbi:MAG: HEAT repeat domain-containing protein, partial [Bacteroidia bacterium]|nr:HEAT repeat domain-containing protein [Bacteroidia bacterium]
MRKILLSFIICLLSVQFMHGQQTIFESTNRVASSFAIFIDKASYEACKESVNKYKELLENEGLATYLLVADWESPEHVKYFIKKYYNEQALEGAVFIGDIPIALIRKG